MFFLIRSTYPWHKQPEVNEIWNKASPPPPYSKSVGVFTTTDLENGVKSYSIVEVEDGKEAEWVQVTAQNLMRYSNIEGYRLQVDMVFKAPEPGSAPTG